MRIIGWAALAVALAGCSGDAIEEFDADEMTVTEMAAEDDPIDVIVPLPPANPDPEHPLCDGETGWVEGDCQTLVYKLTTGYCNRYSPCGQL